ncbi:MAG: hypothetical protein HRF42_12650 [Candidatus Brocadia sp.]|jgi:hypothetical protein
MKLDRKTFKRYFTFILAVPILLMVLQQTLLFGGVKPGTYRVNISADTIEIGEDTWVFSENGKFESEGLNIDSDWGNTGDNAFEIKADKKEISDIINVNLLLIGLLPSDYSLNIKTVDISGTSKGNTIKGKIQINSSIKVKNPIKITFKTNGSADFKGKLIQP